MQNNKKCIIFSPTAYIAIYINMLKNTDFCIYFGFVCLLDGPGFLKCIMFGLSDIYSDNIVNRTPYLRFATIYN